MGPQGGRSHSALLMSFSQTQLEATTVYPVLCLFSTQLSPALIFLSRRDGQAKLTWAVD